MNSIDLSKPGVTRDPKFLAEIRKLPCIVCGTPAPSTVSHIKTRGSGGGDDWFNCVPKCVHCHILWGKIGAFMFCERYPHFRRYLSDLGWYFEGTRLKHPSLLKEWAS